VWVNPVIPLHPVDGIVLLFILSNKLSKSKSKINLLNPGDDIPVFDEP
jgi:hypothetical protein